jgi:hypothetical protein
VASSCDQQSASSAPAAPAATPAQERGTQSAIDRGKELVELGGCNNCHTPKKMGPSGPELDTSRLLSGHPEDAKVVPYRPAGRTPWTIATNDGLTAWSGPWGVSFAANLTPDPNTGLRSGVWTRDLFIKALRSGKHMGTARPILPPMPYQDVAGLSDADLGAIWEYLGSLPAVQNHVPDPIPPAGAAKPTN